jgi:RNA polymerase sigma-70 factor (ECF subfamily)
MSGLATMSPRRQEESAERLVRTFAEARPELVHRLSTLLGSPEDAQDAAQETFLKCWRARAKLPHIRNLRAWIFRVGLNAGRDLLRTGWRRHARPVCLVLPPAQPAATSPAEELVTNEALERIRAALINLRPAERDVFLLRQNSDLTYEQIAGLRGRPVGTLKTLMRSALHKLRKVLQDPAPECP